MAHRHPRIVAAVKAQLDRFGIRFHLTGGIASVAYGEPRLTQDIDLVVDSKRLIAVESDFVAALSKLVSISLGRHRSRRDLRCILAGAKPEALATVRVAARDMNLGELLDQALDEPDEIER